MTMSIVLLELEDANRFANEFSLPLRVVNSCEFAIGTVDGAGDLHGVAVCTDTDNKKTLEINYICTDGWYNASFVLCEACCRFAKNMGYTKIITYTATHDNDKALKHHGFNCNPLTNLVNRFKKKTTLWSKELV